MAYYYVVVPVTRGERTFYSRVGALFENRNKETGETYYTVQLDYPVGATKLLAFPPRAREDEAAPGEAEGSTGEMT